jgi:hypothetical protein
MCCLNFRKNAIQHQSITIKQQNSIVLAICLATKTLLVSDTPNTATISFGNIVLSTVQIYGGIKQYSLM